MQQALETYVSTTFAGIGSLFLIGFVVVIGIALTYVMVRR